MATDPDASWRTALRLEYFTALYNIFEAFASILFGATAGSIALIGFGLDSIVESLSGLVLVWRLRSHDRVSPEEEERIERAAERLVALTFFVLALYIFYESVNKLLTGEIPRVSIGGILIALLSIVIMPVLGWQKRRIGTTLGSRALLADATETITCGYLSIALLFGLLANAFFGFWQADPLVGFVIAAFLVLEGYEGWKGSCSSGD